MVNETEPPPVWPLGRIRAATLQLLSPLLHATVQEELVFDFFKDPNGSGQGAPFPRGL